MRGSTLYTLCTLYLSSTEYLLVCQKQNCIEISHKIAKLEEEMATLEENIAAAVVDPDKQKQLREELNYLREEKSHLRAICR